MDAMRLMTPEQLATTPADIPPPGVIPNLVNPPTIGYRIIGVVTILMTIAWIFAALRFYAAISVRRKFMLDDWTALVSVAGSIYYYVVLIVAVVKVGFGTHMWNISIAHALGEELAMISFMINAPTHLIWPFVKTTFFLAHLQLFRPLVWLRYCCYIGIALTWSWYLTQFSILMAFTLPAPGHTFQEDFNNARYERSYNIGIPAASVGLALDLIIFTLPLVAVSSLRLNFWKKIGVIAMFSTGFLACVASSVSLYFQHYLTKHTEDYMYYVSFVVLCYCIEMTIGISVAAMPSVARLHRVKESRVSSMLSSIGLFRKTRTQDSEEIGIPVRMIPKKISPWPEVSTLKSSDFSDTSLLKSETEFLEPPVQAKIFSSDQVRRTVEISQTRELSRY